MAASQTETLLILGSVQSVKLRQPKHWTKADALNHPSSKSKPKRLSRGEGRALLLQCFVSSGQRELLQLTIVVHVLKPKVHSLVLK